MKNEELRKICLRKLQTEEKGSRSRSWAFRPHPTSFLKKTGLKTFSQKHEMLLYQGF